MLSDAWAFPGRHLSSNTENDSRSFAFIRGSRVFAEHQIVTSFGTSTGSFHLFYDAPFTALARLNCIVTAEGYGPFESAVFLSGLCGLCG
jgi:hypothetical protein